MMYTKYFSGSGHQELYQQDYGSNSVLTAVILLLKIEVRVEGR